MTPDNSVLHSGTWRTTADGRVLPVVTDSYQVNVKDTTRKASADLA